MVAFIYKKYIKNQDFCQNEREGKKEEKEEKEEIYQQLFNHHHGRNQLWRMKIIFKSIKDLQRI